MANIVSTTDTTDYADTRTGAEDSSATAKPLAGYEILVLNGSDTLEKFDFEHKATVLGAKIVQSPPSPVGAKFLAVAGKDCGVRVKNLRAGGTVDILKGEWLLECETKGAVVPFKTSHFVYLTESTRSFIQSQGPRPIQSNEELKAILSTEIPADRSDPQAIKEICSEFVKFGIPVPGGFGQVIPMPRWSDGQNPELNELKDKFVKLKLEYNRSTWT